MEGDDGDDIYSNRAGSPNGVVSQADAAAVFQLPRFKLKSSGIHANSSYSIKSSGSADSSEFTLESENLANRKESSDLVLLTNTYLRANDNIEGFLKQFKPLFKHIESHYISKEPTVLTADTKLAQSTNVNCEEASPGPDKDQNRTADKIGCIKLSDTYSETAHSSSSHLVDNFPSSYCKGLRWIDNMEARYSIIIAITAFYATVMTIFALVFELSRLLSGENRRCVSLRDLFFGLYMHGVSIVFLAYCYIVLLRNPRWKVCCAERLRWFEKMAPSEKEDSSEKQHKTALCKYSENVLSDASAVTMKGALATNVGIAKSQYYKTSHDSPSAGSLFLRLGCVVFGVIGVVYYAFSAFLCASDGRCDPFTILLNLLAIVFVFAQMHFVFCNWKLSIAGSQTLARFGTMHVVASNLWTWIRYILIEESTMNEEIREVFARDTGIWKVKTAATRPLLQPDLNASPPCVGPECILASLSEVMYTSIVEYSLIGAGVMLIVWRNIDYDRQPSTVYVRRKHQIRVNCSKSSTGLFIGLAYLAATFTLMAIFSGYIIMRQMSLAATVFAISDIGQYIFASMGCACALWQMRQLHFRNWMPSTTILSAGVATKSNASVAESGNVTKSDGGQNRSQELLDVILLAFGMSGEMIYSLAGVLGLSAGGVWEPLSALFLAVHLARMSQVGLQTCLIYISSRLCIKDDETLRHSQPGKQAITFLLLANISMFLMNLLEAEKAGISNAVVNFYGKKSWVFLVRSFSPLTIFYRFHSSVCLAEVWKNTYSPTE